MKSRLRLLASLATFLGIASHVSAADLAPVDTSPVVIESSGGFYLGSFSSVNFLDDTGFGVAGRRISTDYDAGYYTAGRVGYTFSPMSFVSPRVELEVGYGSASVDEHRVSGFRGVDGINSFGDARTLQGYLNGYLDVPIAHDGILSGLTPFIGGGVGVMNLELRKQGVAGVATFMDDDDTRFSYHLDAGVAIDIQSVGLFRDNAIFEKTIFDIGYRYTAADDFKFVARDGTNSSTDFRSHAVTFGLRKQF